MQVLDNGRRLHLGDAADATKSALSRFSNGVTAALMTPLNAIQNAMGGSTAAVPSVAVSSVAASEAQAQRSRQDSRQDSPSSTVLDDAQDELPRQDLRSTEAAPPQAAALPAGAKVRVSVRAPSSINADASPMEERLAGKHTAHAPHSWVDCANGFPDICI